MVTWLVEACRKPLCIYNRFQYTCMYILVYNVLIEYMAGYGSYEKSIPILASSYLVALCSISNQYTYCPPMQHAFRRNPSCRTELLLMIHKTKENATPERPQSTIKVCNGTCSLDLIVWVRPISGVYGLTDRNYMLLVSGQIHIASKRVHR